MSDLIVALMFLNSRRRRRRGGRSCGAGGVQLFLIDAGCCRGGPDDVLLLKTTPATQIRSIIEHIVRIRIERPVGSFARFLVVARDFDETLVQTQIVADGILPTLDQSNIRSINSSKKKK